MKRVFVINGSGGSGKDTFVQMVGGYTRVFNFSSIDIVKDAARVLGWSGGKSDKDRKFLSDMKDLAIAYNDAPLHAVLGAVDYFLLNDANLMFIHIREVSEIEKFLKAVSIRNPDLSVQTLIVINPNVDVIQTNKSDSGVFDYNYDLCISNDGGLDDLDVQAKTFVDRLISS